VTTYYYSPFYIPAVDIKLDSTNPALDLSLAIDLVTSVMQAFSTSQSLAAHNLWNLYMGEELRDVLPHLIINTAFTQMCELTGGSLSPLFGLQVLLSIRGQAGESTLFKSFGKLIEDGLIWVTRSGLKFADSDLTDRASNIIAYYVSQ
jgi:hypothetical protein